MIPDLSYLRSLKRRRTGVTPNMCPRASPNEAIRTTLSTILTMHRLLTTTVRNLARAVTDSVVNRLLSVSELALFTKTAVGPEPHYRNLK